MAPPNLAVSVFEASLTETTIRCLTSSEDLLSTFISKSSFFSVYGKLASRLRLNSLFKTGLNEAEVEVRVFLFVVLISKLFVYNLLLKDVTRTLLIVISIA